MIRDRSFRGTSSDYWGLAFISVGSIILLFFGWIIGAILVAKSKSWSRRDKWIALLLPPGGYAFLIPWFIFMASVANRICHPSMPEQCPPYTGTQTIVVAVTYALLVLPLASTAFLAYKLWQPRGDNATHAGRFAA